MSSDVQVTKATRNLKSTVIAQEKDIKIQKQYIKSNIMDDKASHHLEKVTSQLKNLEYDLAKLNARKSRLESDDTDSSDEDEEKPLSHAEESAIEECLYDTEGSLSNVDLNIFDEIDDGLHQQRVKKSRQKRKSEQMRMNMDFDKSCTDCDSSSLDEITYSRQIAFRRSSLAETSWSGATEPMNVDRRNIQTSMDQTINDTANLSLRGDIMKGYNTRRVVRRKRRNSPPVGRNDKAHVHSFFYAMADLVSTFPNGHIEMAKCLVNSILQEMVEDLKKRLNDTEPNSTPQDHAIVPTDLRLIEYRLARLPFVM